MINLIWILLAFMAGSLPFSVWVGRLVLRTDIRWFGDHNPGATNVLRAGGKKWGAVALLLDTLKGVIPVALANFWAGLSGWSLVAVAVAPILGHAFSPFLRFKGGKAVAATFGIWIGLTIGEVPLLLGIALILWYAIVNADGWVMMLALLSVFVYLFLFHTNSVLPLIWAGNALILTWKHRADLAQRPELRPWLTNLVRQKANR